LGENRGRDYLSSLLLLCSHVASNFSSSGSSFLFPCPASHGCAVAICSNFLLGLCCHLQVASYLLQSVIFHHVIANCCYLSVCDCAALLIFCLCLLLSICCLLSILTLLLASCYWSAAVLIIFCHTYISPLCSIQVHIHSFSSSKPCMSTISLSVSQYLLFILWLAESRRFS